MLLLDARDLAAVTGGAAKAGPMAIWVIKKVTGSGGGPGGAPAIANLPAWVINAVKGGGPISRVPR